jgi:subtilisin family serine protease
MRPTNAKTFFNLTLNIMNYMKSFLSILFASILLTGCGAAAIVSTPIGNVDNTPVKETPLTEAESHHWGHLDLQKDTIPGMSVDKAYAELLQGKKGRTVIVAVIDSGIDIDHEDLNDNVWVNEDEIPNNGKDDDSNGFVDDVHGWNFLGTAYDEQLELVRLLASGDRTNPRYDEAQAEYEENRSGAESSKTRYEQIFQMAANAQEALSAHFGKEDFTADEVRAIETDDENLKESVSAAKQMYGFGFSSLLEAMDQLKGGIEYFSDQVNFNYNIDFRGRTTGDNPDDFSQTSYGDNNVKPVKKSESHGTHVAGIIAAERQNGIGMDGVANNVKIMAVRAVPNGDEYDKDVALAIRYAADNGAKVINTSFGKYYSPHSDKVREAIAYAGSKDVLIVNAAGNEGADIDTVNVFPNDTFGTGPEVSNTFLSVGSITSSYGSKLVSGFSNYGAINVDLFAPGSAVYSTTPENEYDSKSGTSMAAPSAAGVAALIRSYYPKLSAAEVKQIMMASGLKINREVIIGGDPAKTGPFEGMSQSGRIVNAYNALVMAAQRSK